jgi:hypothetical protein
MPLHPARQVLPRLARLLLLLVVGASVAAQEANDLVTLDVSGNGKCRLSQVKNRLSVSQ